MENHRFIVGFQGFPCKYGDFSFPAVHLPEGNKSKPIHQGHLKFDDHPSTKLIHPCISNIFGHHWSLLTAIDHYWSILVSAFIVIDNNQPHLSFIKTGPFSYYKPSKPMLITIECIHSWSSMIIHHHCWSFISHQIAIVSHHHCWSLPPTTWMIIPQLVTTANRY